jgi:hypothetical protein
MQGRQNISVRIYLAYPAQLLIHKAEQPILRIHSVIPLTLLIEEGSGLGNVFFDFLKIWVFIYFVKLAKVAGPVPSSNLLSSSRLQHSLVCISSRQIIASIRQYTQPSTCCWVP